MLKPSRPTYHHRFAALCMFGLAVGTPSAAGQNPNWPPSGIQNPSELRSPELWPDDPHFGYDISGTQSTCISTDRGPSCWDNRQGGAFAMWSWIPPRAERQEGFRTEESATGAGTWTDMAWQYTTGDPSVVIAVLDSGIRWQEKDLVNQHAINAAELDVDVSSHCRPQSHDEQRGFDADQDGFVTMADWFFGLSEKAAQALTESIDTTGNQNGIADPGDLIVLCSDGIDQDENGYPDDISGWDFFHNDNDPSDDIDLGHGTSEARWSAAAGNDGQGRIGFCPNCRVLMVRVGDSYVVDAQRYALGVVFAVDSGASLIQEAIGSFNHTTFARRAHDYAYENDVLVVASSADENSRHPNFPGTGNHTLYVNALTHAGSNPQNATSFLAFNNCTNYGGQLVISAPGKNCSSEATATTAGISGLVLSMAQSPNRPGGPLDPPLSAEELRQLLIATTDDIFIPESQPDHPERRLSLYPSREGWDQRFGYGRVNAYSAVQAVRQNRIPPEVDITAPDWFHNLYPTRTPEVTLRGKIAADRANSFDYRIEWAAGIEPDDQDFETLQERQNQADPIEGDLLSWDISQLRIDNPGEVENRFAVTVRIRVTAHYADPIGTVQGEQRRVFNIVDDPTLLAGFPIALGVRNDADDYPAASGEGSVKLADIDGDQQAEILYADADGLLHIFDDRGREYPGYPIQLGALNGLGVEDNPSLLGSAGYASGTIPTHDVASSAATNSIAVGDLDQDGQLEVVASTVEGQIFAITATSRQSLKGFPVTLPEVLSSDPLRGGPTGPDSSIEQGFFAPQALHDLDGDNDLEIIAPAMDGHLYVFDHDGSHHPGFPVEVTAPRLWVNPEDARPGRLTTAVAIGDVNGDGVVDIAFGSNEIGSDKNSGAVHLVHGDGHRHDGGPFHENWPITVTSVQLFPLVAEGIVSAPAMADVNDDGRPDIAISGTAAPIFIVDGIQPERQPGEDFEPLVVIGTANRGPWSNIDDPSDIPLLQTFAHGAFTDLDLDGRPDYSTGGAGLRLALSLAGGYGNRPFSHQVAVWHTWVAPNQRDSDMLPGFPQRIEDYLFFLQPTSADVNADGYPELVAGSGGYWIHAWDGCGREAEGWPKFTGGWVTSATTFGDIDGDGLLEAVATTRNGYLFAWNTHGPVDSNHPWPQARHDLHNSNNFEQPLDHLAEPTAVPPLVCPTISDEDGGVEESMDSDPPGTSGCDCQTVGAVPRPAPFAVGFGLLVFAILRRSKFQL